MDENISMFTPIKFSYRRLLLLPLMGLIIICQSALTYAKTKPSYVGTFGEQKDKNWLSGAYLRFNGDSDSIGFPTARFSAFAASVKNFENNNKQTHFVTVDGSVGYQIGRQFYLYTDVGIDLGEVIAWLEFSDDDTSLDPDRYFTIGTGLALGNFSVNLYTKNRAPLLIACASGFTPCSESRRAFEEMLVAFQGRPTRSMDKA